MLLLQIHVSHSQFLFLLTTKMMKDLAVPLFHQAPLWAARLLSVLRCTEQEWPGKWLLFPPLASVLESCRKFEGQRSQHPLKHRQTTLGCSASKTPNIHYLVVSFPQLKYKLDIPDRLPLKTCNKETAASQALFLHHPQCCYQPGTFFVSIPFPRNLSQRRRTHGEDTHKTYLYSTPVWALTRRGRAWGRAVLAGEQLGAKAQGY